MKHTFAKLLCLLLVLAFTLTGCGNRDVAEMEKQMEELKKIYDTVLADYDGGSIKQLDVMASFWYNYAQYADMYAYFGMTMDEMAVQTLMQDVLYYAVEMKAVEKKFDELGLTLGTSLEELEAQALAIYQENYDYMYENYTTLKDEAAKAAQTEYMMYQQGYTKELIKNAYIQNEKYLAVQEALRAEVAELTDEELEAIYTERVAEDEAIYSVDPTAIESLLTEEGASVYWMPEGYRTVKHILVLPEEEVLQTVTDARNAYDAALAELEGYQAELDAAKDDDAETSDVEEARAESEIQADIDAKQAELPALESAVADAEAACLASVQDQLDTIYAELDAGADFDTVMATYGEDPGMQREPTMTTGYYVSLDSITWDANFAAGAMLLESVGSYSETPVISTSGVHIIYYNSDAVPGAVAFEDVRDELFEAEMETLRQNYVYESFASWVEELKPVYNLGQWML